MATRCIAVVTTVLVVLSSVSVPMADAAPSSATGAAPTQRTGSATGNGHSVSASTTDTSLTAPRRAVVKPPGAVPDTRAVPPLTGDKPQSAARVAHPTVTAGPATPGFDPKTSVEMPANRTATTQTYRNQDGTHTLRLYPSQANVRQPDGSWSPVDLSLVPAPRGLAPKNAPYPVSFSDTATSGALVAVTVDAQHSLSFGLSGAAAVSAHSHGDTATYRGVRPGADLTLTATRAGVEENLVLASPSAPTGYTYPLTTVGLNPLMDNGEIRFTDASGKSLATIPAGLMTDAKGATSTGVRYTLTKSGAGWQLQVDLDRSWLSDPQRAYPVAVDPSVQISADSDDTYVRSGLGDESGAADLQIGQTGSGIARSYLHFGGLNSGALENKYIDGASLVVDDIDAASCTATPVTLFRVASPWSGGGLRWPGAAVNKAYQTKSFAHGPAGCGPAWEGFTIDPNDVTAWTHGSAFYGLSLRAADESSASGFKRLASADSANSPYLDVTYADQGAAYAVSELLLPTANGQGKLTVDVTNQGSSSWTPGGDFKLGFTVSKGGSVVYTSTPAAPSTTVNPMATGTWQLPIPAMAPANYTIQMTMYKAGQDFRTAYGVPYGTMPMTVQNVPPTVNYEQPGTGASVGSITPTLYAEGIDPDNWPGGPLKYNVKICAGTPDAPTNCVSSGWTGQTWTPPAGTLKWSQTYYWWVQTNDNAVAGPWVGPLALTTSVPQPEITGHLAGSPDSEVGPGLDAQIGNYSTQATDASVRTAGPDLTVTRTYNSLDPRRGNAFGVGWSSRVDTRLAADQDGSGNMVVTLPTGRQVRFGRNADGAFAPPDGENLALVYNSGTGVYTMRDGSGNQWLFDVQGRLTTVKDPAGLTETLGYDSADRVVSIVNQTSKRSLTLTWPAGTGGHVQSVQANGGPLWTYTYVGDQLTSVCAPGPAPNCTHYTYGTGSHYRSSVLDDDPRAYYRLNESSDSTPAASVTARTAGADSGQYHGVVLGTPGALAGTGDTAGVFDGNSSYVTLPDKLVSPSMSLSVELWFKTTSGGVLLSYQNGNAFPDQSGTLWTPLLYVGTDGYLYGGFWVPKPDKDRQAVSTTTVNDNQWHHVVLSAAITTQTLYLDGVAQDTVQGAIDHQQQIHLTVGAGRAQGWPATNGGSFTFAGSIDELAVYLHPLGALAAGEHYRAAQQATELTQITQPQDDRLFAKLTYSDGADRVATLLDHQGRTWTLGAPAVNNSTRTVVVHGPYPDWTYTFDVDHEGRLTSTQHGGATTTYAYNTAGFLASVTDPDKHTVTDTTDARGNVLSQTSCRTTGSCNTSYFTYFLDNADPLDPRDDRMLTSADARSSGPADTTYQTTYAYDAAGRLTSTTYPPSSGAGRSTVTATYSDGSQAATGGGSVPAGLLLTSTGRRGQLTTYGYDAAGNLVQTVSPTGLHTDYGYDNLGRATTVTVANSGDSPFGTTTYSYTDQSQIASSIGPAVRNSLTGVTHQQVTTYGYDGDGNVTAVSLSDTATRSIGGDATRTTTYGYDGHDQLVSTTYPDGGVQKVSYAQANQQITTTDPNGTSWIDLNDDQGRLLARTAQGPGVDPQDPTATSVALEYLSYDPAGRLASTTDAMGRLTSYSYYDDNLPASTTLSGFRDADGARRDVVLDQYSYDPAGNVTQRTNAGGGVTASSYDAAGYLHVQTVDPTGVDRATTFVRDADGNPTQASRTGAATPSRTELSTFSYGPDDQVTQENDELSSGTFVSTSRGYDERGLETTATDQNRNTTNYSYDATGALVTTTGPAIDTWVAGTRQAGVRPTQTLGHDAFGDTTQQQDANGGVTNTSFDGMGRAVSTTMPDYTPPGQQTIHAIISTAYDHVGNPITVTDALGRVTTGTYDPYGNVLTRTQPRVGADPSTTTSTYDRDGELLSVTNPTGARTTATYDDLGRQITQTAVERVPAPTTYDTVTTAYDDAGDPLTVTNPGGGTSTAAYDKVGEPTSRTDPTGRTTAYGYDIAGRVASTTDSSGLVTSFGYDLLGRQTSVVQSKNGTTLSTATHAFDADGNVTAATSPAGRQTTFGYDALGNQISQTQQVDANTAISTGYGYDATGDLTRLVDGDGHATDYTYTPWGLPESTVEPATSADPNRPKWTSVYDAAGELVGQQLPGGVSRTYAYDVQGRLTTETGSGAEASTTNRSIGYDVAGRVTRIGTPSGNASYSYDDRGDLVQSPSASYTYTPDGLMATRSDSTGKATFGYDAAGRLASMIDPVTGRTVNYTYNQGGQLGLAADGSSSTVSRTYSYDNLERLTSDQVTQTVEAGTPPRVLLGDTYTYDADNNITGKTTTQSNTSVANTYSYDGASRLTSWTSGNTTTNYAWDGAGDRTRSGATTYTYNERNQLVSDGTSTYSYTPRGTLSSVVTGSTSRAQSYDAFDRLATDGSTTYTYDSLDRVATRNGTAFTYDDLTNNEVSDGGQTLSRTPDGSPFASKSASSAQLLYANQHGDVTGSYLSSTVAGTTTFDPFGTVTGSAGAQPSLGYQGDWTDPSTGQVNMTARWYDPATGSFDSRDDISPTTSAAAAGNRYAYAADNPVTNSDPTGHYPGGLGWLIDNYPTVGLVLVGAACSLNPVPFCVLLALSGIAWLVYEYEKREFEYQKKHAKNMDPQSGPHRATPDDYLTGVSGAGGGLDDGSYGDGGSASYGPPPPPQWLINAQTPLSRPRAGSTVKPRQVSVNAVTRATKIVNPGPGIVARATKITACDSSCQLNSVLAPTLVPTTTVILPSVVDPPVPVPVNFAVATGAAAPAKPSSLPAIRVSGASPVADKNWVLREFAGG